jgi:hypothetical protein
VNRLVWIDPDGLIDHDWMAVIVCAVTGISYGHQYGGTACRQGVIEGYLVPVFSGTAYSRLRVLFEEALQGTGTWNLSWPEDLLAELHETVGMIGMPPSPDTGARTHTGTHAESLVLDEARIGELDEAWVPVISADGPAVLIWPNSD